MAFWSFQEVIQCDPGLLFKAKRWFYTLSARHQQDCFRYVRVIVKPRNLTFLKSLEFQWKHHELSQKQCLVIWKWIEEVDDFTVANKK